MSELNTVQYDIVLSGDAAADAYGMIVGAKSSLGTEATKMLELVMKDAIRPEEDIDLKNATTLLRTVAQNRLNEESENPERAPH